LRSRPAGPQHRSPRVQKSTLLGDRRQQGKLHSGNVAGGPLGPSGCGARVGARLPTGSAMRGRSQAHHAAGRGYRRRRGGLRTGGGCGPFLARLLNSLTFSAFHWSSGCSRTNACTAGSSAISSATISPLSVSRSMNSRSRPVQASSRSPAAAHTSVRRSASLTGSPSKRRRSTRSRGRS